MTNEFRFNYSRSRANGFYTLDNFGGAVPPSNSVLFPSFAPQGSSFVFFGDLNPYGLRYNFGKAGNNLQQQINVTDNLSYTVGAHQLKFGIDYRRLESDEQRLPLPIAVCVSVTLEHHRQQGTAGIRYFEVPSYPGFSELEPLRPGHMEHYPHPDDHLWPALGLQRLAFLAQRHTSVHGGPGQQSQNYDTGASGHAVVACAERRFCSAPRHRLEPAP